jgi:16S rRNA (guanine966-N2)-methyltransferase
VRETLFNWLGQRLEGLACLDLFAGSGALGFEAASRGARRVVMVERDPRAAASLERVRWELDLPEVQVVRADALAWLGQEGERFDIVFLDPPFAQGALSGAFAALGPALQPGARVYAEAPQPLERVPGFRELRRGRAGQVSYQLFLHCGGHDDTSGLSGNV